MSSTLDTDNEDEEDDSCPICIEPFDVQDKKFFPCPCNYRVCMFCVKRIQTEFDGRCPGCRRDYNEKNFRFETNDDEQKLKKNRDSAVGNNSSFQQVGGKKKVFSGSGASQKGMPARVQDRKRLSNVRVIQRNLVYLIGLAPSVAREETLRRSEYFGQYGKIIKVVVKIGHAVTQTHRAASASAYITYSKEEDAKLAIQGVDGFWLDGHMIRASYGTTKYCNMFLRGLACNNPECLYLHKLGDDSASFTKEEMQSIGKNQFHDMTHIYSSDGNGGLQTHTGVLPPRGAIGSNWNDKQDHSHGPLSNSEDVAPLQDSIPNEQLSSGAKSIPIVTLAAQNKKSQVKPPPNIILDTTSPPLNGSVPRPVSTNANVQPGTAWAAIAGSNANSKKKAPQPQQPTIVTPPVPSKPPPPPGVLLPQPIKPTGVHNPADMSRKVNTILQDQKTIEKEVEIKPKSVPAPIQPSKPSNTSHLLARPPPPGGNQNLTQLPPPGGNAVGMNRLGSTGLSNSVPRGNDSVMQHSFNPPPGVFPGNTPKQSIQPPPGVPGFGNGPPSNTWDSSLQPPPRRGDSTSNVSSSLLSSLGGMALSDYEKEVGVPVAGAAPIGSKVNMPLAPGAGAVRRTNRPTTEERFGLAYDQPPRQNQRQSQLLQPPPPKTKPEGLNSAKDKEQWLRMFLPGANLTFSNSPPSANSLLAPPPGSTNENFPRHDERQQQQFALPMFNSKSIFGNQSDPIQKMNQNKPLGVIGSSAPPPAPGFQDYSLASNVSNPNSVSGLVNSVPRRPPVGFEHQQPAMNSNRGVIGTPMGGMVNLRQPNAGVIGQGQPRTLKPQPRQVQGYRK